jgi:hypothetical protein
MSKVDFNLALKPKEKKNTLENNKFKPKRKVIPS